MTDFEGDRILLTDLGFFGYHGVLAEEKSLGQRFFIDLEIGIDLAEPARSDDVTTTISYADIYDTVKLAFEERPLNLIEALAQKIVDAIFARFLAARWIKIRIRKPEAPIAMVRGSAAIELHRDREDR